jgi:subtilase family serine protease
MRLARVITTVPLLAIVSWGCSQDTSTPTGLSEASTSIGGDFDYIAKPPYVKAMPLTASPAAIPFCATNPVFICYSPQLIRAAYNYPSTLDGTGQTILIVDAFGSPTIQQDLADFDRFFGIPAPPSFKILCPDAGCPTFDPNDPHNELSWSLETSLDVEYAHAMAPGAKIVLVVASTSSGNAINTAEAAALPLYPGSIMSQSFGIPEILVNANNTQITQADKNYQAAQAAGVTVLASSGDAGATNGFATPNAGFPASDPLVTGVGGTQGDPYPGGLAGCGTNKCSGNYGGEQVWNEPQFSPPGATGGAPSAFFDVPSYQSGLGLTSRTVPDVAYNAAINGGVLVVDATLLPGFLLAVGGTSAGSPQWAAIVALANQAKGAPLGFINPALYQIKRCSGKHGSDFHDITVGNNQLSGTPFGFNAGVGYDDATGLGTPNVANLVSDLVSPPSC